MPPMNPYFRFALKSVSVFIGGLGATELIHRATGQISLYDGVAVIWPALLAVGTYWGLVADSTPAPWVTPEQAHAVADKLAAEKK